MEWTGVEWSGGEAAGRCLTCGGAVPGCTPRAHVVLGVNPETLDALMFRKIFLSVLFTTATKLYGAANTNPPKWDKSATHRSAKMA